MHVCPGGSNNWLPRMGLLSLCLLMLAAAAILALARVGGSSEEARAASAGPIRDVVFAIHGGAGGITPEDVPPELERQYRAALRQALEESYRVIRRGGQATGAVKAAIVSMEDNPLFNAGKGAVFTTDAKHELHHGRRDARHRRSLAWRTSRTRSGSPTPYAPGPGTCSSPALAPSSSR